MQCKGYDDFIQFASGGSAFGIEGYSRQDGDNTIIMRQNFSGTEKLIKVQEDGTQTAITTGTKITSNNRMHFVNIKDQVYCMNGVDVLGELDNTTYINTPAGIVNITPSFGIHYQKALWTNNINDPNAMLYSDENDPYTFDPNNKLTFDEQTVGTGISGNKQYIFTETTISQINVAQTAGVYTYSATKVETKEGAINHSSIAQVGSNLYYLTPSNKIKRIAYGQNNKEGYENVELSHRDIDAGGGIPNTMALLDADQSDSFSYYHPTEQVIKWFVKTKGRTFNDLCIIYSPVRDTFMVDDGRYFYDAFYYNKFSKAYSISMLEAKAFEDEEGLNFGGTAIQAQYWTKAFNYGDITRDGLLWENRTQTKINRIGQLQEQIFVDGGQVHTSTADNTNIAFSNSGVATYPTGVPQVGTGGRTETIDDMFDVPIITTKAFLQNRGRRIQFRYSSSILNAKFELLDINFKREILPADSLI